MGQPSSLQSLCFARAAERNEPGSAPVVPVLLRASGLPDGALRHLR